MSLFQSRPDEDDAAYLGSASRVSQEPAFKKELEVAISECLAGCLDAIKAKDYPRAELMNDVSESIRLILKRFEELHAKYEDLANSKEDSE